MMLALIECESAHSPAFLRSQRQDARQGMIILQIRSNMLELVRRAIAWRIADSIQGVCTFVRQAYRIQERSM
ncbi:hypothetical protein Q2941_22300 [Bradyrhizobium sp. UFLA05-153]